MKAKARILKTAGERQLVMYKTTPIRQSAEKQKLCRSKESDRVNSKWWKGKKNPTIKSTLFIKAVIHIWRRDEEFYRQVKPKEFSTTKLPSQEILNGLL